MVITLSILAILSSLIGLFLPMGQALLPRISLYTYYRQRLLRRIFAILGIVFLVPPWILAPSTSTWIVSIFVVFCWLVSELVLTPTKVIPPLDNPPALTGKDALLPEDTQVLGVILEGRAHAWPMGILIPHHIINETVHGTPVTAAYCPACRSGYIFDPVVEGQRLTFEPVSVHRRNLIMRDRETGTIWQHETGEALMGKYRSKTLAILGGELSNWKAWRTEHPETTVCIRPEGYRHPSPLGPVFGKLLDHVPKHMVSPGLFGLDQRLDQHAFIAGITLGEQVKAYPLDVLQDCRIINDLVGSQSIVIFYDASSDRVRCFSVDTLPQGSPLEMRENQLHDPAAHHSWDFSGKAIDGKSDPLTPIRVQRQWWLAWSEYHPGSQIYASSLPTWVHNLYNDNQGIQRTLAEGVRARIFAGQNAMLSIVRFEPNATHAPHSHPQEQWGVLLEGEGTRLQGGEAVPVKTGDFWHTPGGVSHTLQAGPAGALVLDIFSPPRPEYTQSGEGSG